MKLSFMQSFFCDHRFKAFCVFFSIFFTTFCCFAQQQKIDSLKKILLRLKDTARIDCLNQLSYEYIQLDKEDSARRYNDLAHFFAQQHQYSHGIAVSFAYKAQMAKHFEDDFVKAETFGKEALLWFERTTNKVGLTMYTSILVIQPFHKANSTRHLIIPKNDMRLPNKLVIHQACSMLWDLCLPLKDKAGIMRKPFYMRNNTMILLCG